MYSKALLWLRYGKNMGLRYILFRLWYETQKHLGLMRFRFPVNPAPMSFMSLSQWRTAPSVFGNEKEIPPLNNQEKAELKARIRFWQEGKIRFFNAKWLPVSGWHTHPQKQFVYDASVHWSKIKIYQPASGDIKWVWEKSRFSFVYDLIRYDFHFKEDQSEAAISTIIDWIDGNPVNCGPNWICSQEISLRIFAWTFTLQYYRHAAYLTEARLNRILNSIYQQILHVEKNISFSRIAVRNNHALTETCGLYFTGLIYPLFPGSENRKRNGKKWFTEEITFQIEQDGTFLQSSMNYHRMAVQLVTLAIRVSDVYKETLYDIIYSRAKSSLYFLHTCQDRTTGWLPNYGNNDGTLIFPLSSCAFRDFRPQLCALSAALHVHPEFGPGPWNEEAVWLGLQPIHKAPSTSDALANARVDRFDNGGYYTLRDDHTLTFLRCASYRHRPFQADNLHLDIWVDGENIMRDAGTYLYTSTDPRKNYFSGTSAHNTVSLGSLDQMRKGPGFIWLDWVKESAAEWRQENEYFVFEGWFKGFRQAGSELRHCRKITKKRHAHEWVIEDELLNAPSGLPMNQFWHPSKTFFDHYVITAFEKNGNEIEIQKEDGLYAETYGMIETAQQLRFTTSGRYIRTIITSNNFPNQ